MRNLDALDQNDEVKFVLSTRRDYEFAREFIALAQLASNASGRFFLAGLRRSGREMAGSRASSTGRVDAGRRFARTARIAVAQIRMGPGHERRLKDHSCLAQKTSAARKPSCSSAAAWIRASAPPSPCRLTALRTSPCCMPAMASAPSVANATPSKPSPIFTASRTRLIVQLDHFRAIGGSALTDQNIAVPENQTLPQNSRTKFPSPMCPFATLTFFRVAVSWAEVHRRELHLHRRGRRRQLRLSRLPPGILSRLSGIDSRRHAPGNQHRNRHAGHHPQKKRHHPQRHRVRRSVASNLVVLPG